MRHLRLIFALGLLTTWTSTNANSAEVINAGVGGNRSHNLLARLDRDALKHKPTVVVLMVGTNDRLNSGGFVEIKDYRKNVELLIDRIQSHDAKTVLVTPPTCLPGLLFTRHDRQKFSDQSPVDRMKEVRDILIDVARTKHVRIVDFHGHLLDNDIADDRRSSVIRNVANSGVKDGVHLTARGYELLAELVAQEFAAAKYDASRVVCFGDSLTKGSEATNYPMYLGSILSKRSTALK